MGRGALGKMATDMVELARICKKWSRGVASDDELAELIRVRVGGPSPEFKALQQLEITLAPPAERKELAKLQLERKWLATLQVAMRALKTKGLTIREVKDVHEFAQAARDVLRRAHASRVTQNYAAEVSLYASRRAGRALLSLKRSQGRRTDKLPAAVAGSSEYQQALDETKTSGETARRWQRIAKVQEEIWQEYIFKQKVERDDEISAAGLMAFAAARGDTTALAQRFGAPPFSVLDLKQGYWADRKRAWEELGLKGDAGRGDEHEPALDINIATYNSRTDISVFNPALAETMYTWFAPAGGHVLDPFAGGATRGIVAAKLGYKYTGIELRPGQVRDNYAQAEPMGLGPAWVCGDSAKLSSYLGREKFDLIFTCPPYFDLERYTEADERDGSRFKTYAEFMAWYENVFRQAVQHLKRDRFAVVVVGEIRDERGFYRNFVGDTTTCLLRLGLRYYNEIILATPIGSLPCRDGAPFSKYRKIGKSHQNVLCFWKGDDAKRIPQVLGALGTKGEA